MGVSAIWRTMKVFVEVGSSGDCVLEKPVRREIVVGEFGCGKGFSGGFCL